MGEWVQVNSLSPSMTTPLNNNADELVGDQFGLAQDYADSAFDNVGGYISDLVTAITSITLPDTSVDYSHVTTGINVAGVDIDIPEWESPELAEDIEVPDWEGDTELEDIDKPTWEGADEINLPDVPDWDGDTDIDDPDQPTQPDLLDIEVHDPVDIPDYDVDDPAADFTHEETDYDSDLLNAAVVSLESMIEDGGTGLGEDVEDAIWDRLRERKDSQNEQVYTEAETYFSARGWDMPPGALSGRLLEALEEQSRADTTINNEIAIEQARLAQNNTQFAHTTGAQIEGFLVADHAGKLQRLLEKAKAEVDTELRTYATLVEGYRNRVDAARLEVEANKLLVDTQVAANASKTDVYRANIDRYRADIQKEVSEVEAAARVFQTKMTGYQAEAQVEAQRVGVNAQVFQTKMTGYQVDVDAAMKEIDAAARVFEARIEKYRAQHEANWRDKDVEARVYGHKVASKEAEMNWEARKLDAQVKELGAKIQQATDEANIDIKEAELALQGYLQKTTAEIEGLKTTATVYAQLAASSLAAVNASASLQSGYSGQVSARYTKSQAISNRATLYESHDYDEA